MQNKRNKFLTLLLAFIFAASIFLTACSSEVTAEDLAADQPASAADSVKPVPAGEAGTWLVMLYQDADDETLEKDIFIDLNEAEMVGSTDAVTIVSQIDRLDGGYDGGDDFTTAKRFLVQFDESGEMEELASEELEDLGEVDMGDNQTLIDFAEWAITNYPADKYALILSDHGMGWSGGWSDNDPTEFSEMTMDKIDEVLAKIVADTGIGQFDLVGFDACLMAQVESISAVAPYAKYTVASEETEPALGWAYASFLQSLADDPSMDGAELAQAIVDSYIEQDGRIIDDRARADLVAETMDATGEPTAEQVAKVFGDNITLTAVDLSTVGDLNAAINDFVVALSAIDQSIVAEARVRAQAYTSIFGKGSQQPYIDLGHFAAILQKKTDDAKVKAAAKAVIDAIAASTVNEKHGPERPGSTGFTVYFPNSGLYEQTINSEWLSYVKSAGRFSAASLWDDFLTFHYTGKKIDPKAFDLTVVKAEADVEDFSEIAQASAPETSAAVTAPGAGKITFNSLTASAEEISVDDTLDIDLSLEGENIGYIYIYTLYYDEESESYVTVDTDFIASEENQEVGGVTYPVWSDDSSIEFSVEWSPTVYMVSDGVTEEFAAVTPDTYGLTAEDTYYTLWGTYTFAGKKDGREAFLVFDANGKFVDAYVFSASDESSQGQAPSVISPRAGDTFTIEEEWLEFDKNEEGEFNYYDGGTLTYGKAGFKLNPYEGLAGNYIVGIIAEDLDGNSYENFIEVTVTE